MASPFIGELRTFAFNFAPRSWLQCNGQLMPISQNQALFSLLGTTFGGNGTTNFALPDLRGRMMRSMGTGPGLPVATLGEQAGLAATTLTASNLPAHTHGVQATVSQPASSGGGGADTPLSNIPANSGGQLNFAAPSAASGSLAPPPGVSVPSQIAGSSQPLSIMPPYLVLNTCIAFTGIFPSRS
jgi:microcystin-dependent protein